jgi:hypothetical protein
LAILETPGCVEFVTPAGGWMEPVDLQLNQESLKGQTIGLECGWEEFQFFRRLEKWEPYRPLESRNMDIEDDKFLSQEKVGGIESDNQNTEINESGLSTLSCFRMAQVIRSLGATLWDPDSKNDPDFKVRYLNLDPVRDYCSWTAVPYVLSFTFFPCIESLSSQAVITLLGDHGKYEKKVNLRADITAVYGFWVFYFIGVDLFRPAANQRAFRNQRLGRDTIQTIQNHIYSFHRQLAKNSLSATGGSR